MRANTNEFVVFYCMIGAGLCAAMGFGPGLFVCLLGMGAAMAIGDYDQGKKEDEFWG